MPRYDTVQYQSAPLFYRFTFILKARGDSPVCFLKKVPKAEALGKCIRSAISLMGLLVFFIRKMLRRTMALKTISCTV